MKKLLLLLPIIFFACSSSDDSTNLLESTSELINFTVEPIENVNPNRKYICTYIFKIQNNTNKATKVEGWKCKRFCNSFSEPTFSIFSLGKITLEPNSSIEYTVTEYSQTLVAAYENEEILFMNKFDILKFDQWKNQQLEKYKTGGWKECE